MGTQTLRQNIVGLAGALEGAPGHPPGPRQHHAPEMGKKVVKHRGQMLRQPHGAKHPLASGHLFRRNRNNQRRILFHCDNIEEWNVNDSQLYIILHLLKKGAAARFLLRYGPRPDCLADRNPVWGGLIEEGLNLPNERCRVLMRQVGGMIMALRRVQTCL